MSVKKEAEFQTISLLTQGGNGGETTSTKAATMVGSRSKWQAEFSNENEGRVTGILCNVCKR